MTSSPQRREGEPPSRGRRLPAGLLLAAVAVAIVIAGTVGATPGATPSDAAAVAASLSDFAIDVGADALGSGTTVTFEVVNEGQLPHNLSIVDGPATGVLDPGEKASLMYQVGGAGTARMICTVTRHEDAGMSLTLPVSPAGS